MEKCDICGKEFSKNMLTPVSFGDRMGQICNECFIECEMCDFCYVFTKVKQVRARNGFILNVCKDCEAIHHYNFDYVVKEKRERKKKKKEKPKYIVIGKNPLEEK